MIPSENNHNKLVVEIATRLHESYHYDSIDCFVNYKARGLDGEVDILARRGDMYHFYEIKCNYSHRNYAKATEQYHRFVKTHPKLKTKGVYVSSQRIRRLH